MKLLIRERRCSSRGFTLIELLVVIAIIGILASLVLVALGTAREKARSARVKAGISQLRVIAEDWYDSQTSATYVGWTGHANYATLAGDITTQGGVISTGTAIPTAFCVSSTLPSGGSYCMDSTGRTRQQDAAMCSAATNDSACPV